MSITLDYEWEGMKKISFIVATVLKEMRKYAQPGMSTKQVDEFGGALLQKFGANSAPKLTYGFPGWTCISLNHEIAHGIPVKHKILKEGDLVNIDVSAEYNGFWSDNGGSFVLGADKHQHQKLVDTSREILKKVINTVKAGMNISTVGNVIEDEAGIAGFKVIRNLTGHGVGKSLHEEPNEILNYHDAACEKYFNDNAVVAIETFISTHSNIAVEKDDGWTLVGNRGGYVAQHEHTLVLTKGTPVVLTEMNGIWD